MRVVVGVLTLNKNGAIRYQSLEVRLKTQRVSELLDTSGRRFYTNSNLLTCLLATHAHLMTFPFRVNTK